VGLAPFILIIFSKPATLTGVSSLNINYVQYKNMKKNQEKVTPLMQQYFEIKAQHADTLLFFQVGDFYELFFDDAKTAAGFLAIALTKRGKNKGEDIPLCGVPVHALNHYLVKLIKGGFRVAICEQLEKPQPGTVVKRGVTHVFTPATLTDTAMLDEKSASYLLSLYPGQQQTGLVFTEILTAQLFATTIPSNEPRIIESELTRFLPDEVIIHQGEKQSPTTSHIKKLGYYTTYVTPSDEETLESEDWINLQFNTNTHTQLSKNQPINKSMHSLYAYLKKNQEDILKQFKTIHFYEPDDYLMLDQSTQKNLELVKNNYDGSQKNTLLSILDRAKTPMGSRTIKKWLLRPLIKKNAILQRQEVVTLLSKQTETLGQFESLLGKISDLERIVGRIALHRATIHDYVSLKGSLTFIPMITTLMHEKIDTPLSKTLQEKIANFNTLLELLECSLADDPESGKIIKKGFDLELDQLQDLLGSGKQALLMLEQAERTKSGINSLKVGYNQVSGYYIEVTNPNLNRVPEYFIEMQQLSNRKRFTTLQLKELEHNLFKAQNQLDDIEKKVFDGVKSSIAEYTGQLRNLAQSIAYLDGLFGLACAAYDNNYRAPIFHDAKEILIKNGRHPVIELAQSQAFIPNDTTLNNNQSTWIITGPNMGGKSTYLRQTALICIMAQCGSLVPAEKAELPILDRVFTRIGSGDNLAEGKSTFLVEMEETALICRHATERSLVILDEVGRGTSTYDGISLAQSIVEHIHKNIGALCLFATHYHELTQLTESLPGVVNYHMACKKSGESILFLYKMIQGIAGRSFGLEVARLANLPEEIVQRASTIHQLLTAGLHKQSINNAHQETFLLHEKIITLEKQLSNQQTQLALLKNIDCNTLTPLQALDLLAKTSNNLKKIDFNCASAISNNKTT